MTALAPVRDTTPPITRGRSYDDPHRQPCGTRRQVNCRQKRRYPTMPIIWQDPTPSTRCRFRDELHELLTRPDTWAIITTYTNRATASSAAKRLRGGATCGVAARCETAVRVQPDGTFALFAKAVAVAVAVAAPIRGKTRRTA